MVTAAAPRLSSAAESWPTYQHDPARTGRSTASFDPRQLRLAWQSPTDTEWGYGNPVIADGAVYAIDYHHSGPGVDRLTAFDLATGTARWTHSFYGTMPGGPAVGGGMVVFTDDPGIDGYLRVLDAATGALRYDVPNVSGSGSRKAPLLVRNDAGEWVAYTASHLVAAGVRLGATSGEKTWSRAGEHGTDSAPTLAGDYLILTGPGQGNAYHLGGGEHRFFQVGFGSGGGGNVAAYDATRNQIYQLASTELAAWSLDGTGPLEKKWRLDNFGSNIGRSVAIGPDGKVYTTVPAGLQEIDPDTGTVLRLVPGKFHQGESPIIQDGYVWVGGRQVHAFDLATLSLAVSLPASPLETYWYAPVAMDDSHLIVEYGNGAGIDRGFMVYAVPEPMGVATLLPGAALLLLRRARNSSRDENLKPA
jgi:hypothetical protein